MVFCGGILGVLSGRDLIIAAYFYVISYDLIYLTYVKRLLFLSLCIIMKKKFKFNSEGDNIIKINASLLQLFFLAECKIFYFLLNCDNNKELLLLAFKNSEKTGAIFRISHELKNACGMRP